MRKYFQETRKSHKKVSLLISQFFLPCSGLIKINWKFYLNVASSPFQIIRKKTEERTTKKILSSIFNTECNATIVPQCHVEKEKYAALNNVYSTDVVQLYPASEPYLTSSNLFARQWRVCGQCLFPFHGWGACLFHTWEKKQLNMLSVFTTIRMMISI